MKMSESQKSNPQVSVIVPVYKVEKYLRECVDSILAQDFADYELILVDDGSPDSCPQLCDQLAETDARIRVVHKANGGLSSARNAGLDVACGSYVMFIDSDDVILPRMISEMLTLLNESHADVVTTPLKTWGGPRRNIMCFSEVTEFTGAEALATLYEQRLDMSSCAKIYHRDIIGELRFPFGRINEDFPFVCNVFVRCRKVVYLPTAYYLYRHTPGSITTTFHEGYFHCLTNIAETESLVGDDKRLRRAYDICLCRAHIDAAFKIVRNGCHQRFASYLSNSRAYIRRRAVSLLFDGRIGWRYKVKALLAFSPWRLPI